MELPIKHKRGTTVPTANDLVVGELAINTATGVVYTKTGAGNVVEIGSTSNLIPEAPTDGKTYGRVNAQWQSVLPISGGTLSNDASITIPDFTGPKAILSGNIITMWSENDTFKTETRRNGFSARDFSNNDQESFLGFGYLSIRTGSNVINISSSGIVFPDLSTQTTAWNEAPIDNAQYARQNGQWQVVQPDFTGYATETFVTSQGYLIAGDPATVPAGGDAGQVLTKSSSANYSYVWSSPVIGDRYLTSSTTSNLVSNGAKTFTIGTGLSYTPQQDIIISANDGSVSHMHSVVTSYDPITGVLVVDVQNHTGNGTHSAWIVNVGGVVPLQTLAWGGLTGTLSNQTDLQTALDGKYSTTNPAGYITLSALIPYLTITSANATYLSLATASATYQTIAAMVSYARLALPNTWFNKQTINQGTQAAIRINPSVVDPSTFENGDIILSNNGWLGFRWAGATKILATSSDLGLYALLSGATFTGKINCASVGGLAGINVGIGGTSTSATTAGDLWIATGGTNLNFRDGTGAWRVLATQGQVNSFSVNQIIECTTTTPALRVTQRGTGHSLVIEDGSPYPNDSSAFAVDQFGNVGIGVNATGTNWVAQNKLEIVGGYGTSTTAPLLDESTKLATTAHVKASIRGSVQDIGSSGWALGWGTGSANIIVRVYDDGSSGQMIVPTESPEYISIGTQYVFIQTGNLPFTIEADGGGVQVNSFGNKHTSGGQHAVCTLIKTGVGEWYLAGNLV